MSSRWSDADLHLIDAAREMEIAVMRGDGSLAPWLPLWVVCAGGEIYVRTWYHRDTGWFGEARRSGQARIRVPGLDADVDIDVVGDESAELNTSVNDAYSSKYGSGAGSMVTAEAMSTTLRLLPA